jgi:replicative DNA helicase
MTDATNRAEAALISALLVDPAQIPVVAGMLDPEDFGVRSLRGTFEAMLALVQENKRVDAVTLRSRGVDVSDMVLHGAGVNLPEYAEIIKEGRFRRMVDGYLDTARRLVKDEASQLEILGTLSNLSQAVALEASDGRTYDAERAVHTYAQIRRDRKLTGVGLPYGIHQLDRFLQPAHGGDMIVVAARPSIGKSVLAEHIADNWAFESEHPVMFVSIEMSLGQLMDRAVSRWGGIPSSHIVRGILTDEEDHKVDITLEARKAVNLWYVDNPYATTDTVRGAAAEISMQAGGLRGIIIDYLQLLKDRGDNDNQRIGHVSRNLKALAREYDCPVLVLSQLNRQSEYRDDPHPRLSDIRDSGAVEQDADVVLGLYRDRSEEDGGMLEIEILKNRQGPLARMEVEFDGGHVRLNTEY